MTNLAEATSTTEDAPAPLAFDDPELERAYQQARAHNLAPPKGMDQGLLFIVSIVLFTIAQLGSSVSQIAILIGVILFHEAGHWLGMRLFGYRDVKMFFIPFFGAAVSGRPSGAAAWKEGVVLLAGPLPGIVLGAVGLFVAWITAGPLWLDTAYTLLYINGFNLLPLAGLDGAKLLQRAIFSRHRYLDIAFLVLTGLALILVALVLQMWVLLFFAVLGLLQLPQRRLVLVGVDLLRKEYATVEPDARRRSDAQDRALFLSAREALSPEHAKKANLVSATMESLVEAVRPAPGVLGTVFLLLGWTFGFVVLLGSIVAVAVAHASKWEPFEDAAGRYQVSMPKKPTTLALPITVGGRAFTEHRSFAGVSFVRRYNVAWFDLPDGPVDAQRTFDAERDRLLAERAGKVTRDVPFAKLGDAAREVEIVQPNGRTLRSRLVLSGHRLYTVSASAPSLGEDERKMLESFKLLP